MNTTFAKKKNGKKNSNRTDIRLQASKEMFFATCFILNTAHTYKRPVNKLMAVFKGVFLSLFYKNTGLRSLFNIKLCIRFYIDSI